MGGTAPVRCSVAKVPLSGSSGPAAERRGLAVDAPASDTSCNAILNHQGRKWPHLHSVVASLHSALSSVCSRPKPSDHAVKCRLCLQDRELRESHIIPEFLYRPGYDDKHRMEVLEGTGTKPALIQKGLRERLLCEDCESLFANAYEDYFSRLWYQEKTLPIVADGPHWSLSGLDYGRFKLFHLSILWRAGISSLAPFRRVFLGPTEDLLRQMLLNQDPGGRNDFQIFGVLLLLPGSVRVLDGFIASPTSQVRNGHPLYMFVFGGCVWHYYESSGQPNPLFAEIALSPAGYMTFPVRTLDKVTPLDRFFREYVRHNSP